MCSLRLPAVTQAGAGGAGPWQWRAGEDAMGSAAGAGSVLGELRTVPLQPWTLPIWVAAGSQQ